MSQGTATRTRLVIDVWADVLCPWCYIGEHRLEEAIGRSPHADRIDLRVHSFEINPDAPDTATPTLEILSHKHGMPMAQARAVEEGMARQAAEEGLPYDVNRMFRNTHDMLRVVHLGEKHGVAWTYMRALQTAVFRGDVDAYEDATLIRIGTELGIPAEEIRAVLDSDLYSDQVRADHQHALALGARGVPFTVLGGRLGLPGAVSVADYAAAIEQAWSQIDD